MDPGLASRRCCRCRFPRTRGDGPATLYEVGPVTEFPPHARGWTLDLAGEDDQLGVSPARAGMDPDQARIQGEYDSFPRTRGDGPPLTAALTKRQRFPPHARGWTRRRHIDDPIREVSPARAGMDPLGDRATIQ